MSKPLLKVEMRNLPLSIPLSWMDFFDEHAATLGVSRNAVFRLALKFGGPIVARLCDVARDRLRESLESPCWASEIVASPALLPIPVILVADERRPKSTASDGGRPEKPGGGNKINRGAEGKKARAGCSTGKGNPRCPGKTLPRPAANGNPRRRA